MPSITINISDKQQKKIDEHFRKGILLELEEETIHGVNYQLSFGLGMWFLTVNSQAGDLCIDEIDVEFKD
jgi:hypothetical protein